MMVKMNDIVETFFRKDRFYVRVRESDSKTGIKTMPRANYVWLKSNPVFQEIPKSYVVHHLDGDKTNDDPSNLVIMFKFHHVAHHFKNILPPVKIWAANTEYFPTQYPTYGYDAKGKRYFIRFYEKNIDTGKHEKKRVYLVDGKAIRSEEHAKRCCKKIWHDAYGQEEHPLPQPCPNLSVVK